MQRTVLAAAMRRVLFWVVIIVAVCGVAAPALADPRAEREAQALRKKAIEEDNLNVNYAGAVKKLQTAIAKCGASKCSSSVKAGLLRDLGAMQILNGNVDDGKASFAGAIVLDQSIDLDPAYKNPMLDALWADVKKSGGGTSATAAAPPRGGQPSGDFSHAPPAEAQVHTPLAIYLEYGGTEQLGKVVAKYKGTGMSDWKSVDLKKVGDGYGALIPCKDVLQGSMQYYVVGFNTQNDPVATSGSRNKPFTVAVNAQIAGPVPSLPGRDPPAQCEDTTASECPPDFPGCKAPKKEAGEDCDKDVQCKDGLCIGGKCIEKKGGGEDCESDKECASESCTDGKCSTKKGGGDTCQSDDECTSGKCDDEKCVSTSAAAEGGTLSRFWVGLSVQADIYFMPAASNVCQLNTAGTVPVNTAGYRCVDPNTNTNFPPNGTINGEISTKNDQVLGGAAFGNLRILASLDYALNPNMMIGARAGYVLFTNPSTSTPGAAFAPIHLEARFTYLFGHDALISQTISPLVFAGVGVGEFDAFVPVTVTPIGGGGSPTENAWLTAGPGFFAIGGGARIKLATKVAGTVAVKFEGPFGGTAGFLPGIAPEVGVQFGF